MAQFLSLVFLLFVAFSADAQQVKKRAKQPRKQTATKVRVAPQKKTVMPRRVPIHTQAPAPVAAPAQTFDAPPMDVDDSPYEDTAVSKVAVAIFDTGNEQVSGTELSIIRDGIVRRLNEVSYLTALALNKVFPANANRAQLRSTKSTGAEGVLVGHFGDGGVRVYLKSQNNGITLKSWFLPSPEKRDAPSLGALASSIADAITRDFPYKGYIMFAKEDKVQINVGNRFNVKPGQRLVVFEFEGEDANFSSFRRRIGEVVITQTSQNLAIAQIVKGRDRIERYNKVDIIQEAEGSIQDFDAKYNRGAFIGAGAEVLISDSASAGEPNLRLRRMKLTLTSFPKLLLGYNRLHITYLTGSTQIDDNTMKITVGTVGYELIRSSSTNFSLPLVLGGYYSKLETNTNPSSPTALTSSVTYNPFLQWEIHWLLKQNVRFMGFASVAYPVFSNDVTNGNNNSVASFGTGFGGGLRIYLNPKFAVDGLMQSKWTSYSYPNNSGLQELMYGLSLMGIVLF